MRFAGCLENADARIRLLAAGTEVREASHKVGPFSLRLGRDLTDYHVVDAGEPKDGHGFFSESHWAILAKESNVPGGRLHGAYPDARALVFSGSLAKTSALSTTLGAGTVFALGARTGPQAIQSALRSHQRLLPLTEVDLVIAARTAVAESEEAPLWISLYLDILAPYLAPGVEPVATGGVDLATLRSALEVVPGHRVVGFEILDYPDPPMRNELLVLTAAELLRDNILFWWSPEKVDV